MDSNGRIHIRAGQDSSFVPVVAVEATTSSVTKPPPAPVVYADPQESIRASALPNGEKALTPIIAGTISGTCIGIAWLVALVVALLKRHRRKQRFVRSLAGVPNASRTSDNEKNSKDEGHEPVIIPPDPAIVLGVGKPGEYVLKGKEKEGKGKCKGKDVMRERYPMPAVYNANSSPMRVDISPNQSQSGDPTYLSPTWTRDSDGTSIPSIGRPISNDGRGSTRRSRRMTSLEGVTEEDHAYRSRPPMPRILSGEEAPTSYDNNNEPDNIESNTEEVMHLRGGVGEDHDVDEIMVVQSPTELESESSKDHIKPMR